MPTRCTGKELLNPQGSKAWREDGPTGGQDLWEMHGVWKWDKSKNTGAVLRETYFVNDPVTGRKVCFFFRVLFGWVERAVLTVTQIDWYTDFYYPFLKRWTERVRGAVANGRGHEKLFFTEPVPNEVNRWPFAPDFYTTLLTTVTVLSAIMDTTTPTSKHGIRSPLVSMLTASCGTCLRSHVNAI